MEIDVLLSDRITASLHSLT